MNDETIRDRVLIIDDARTNIKVLYEALRSDYDVVFATNGRDGIQAAMSEKPPELILLDILMPGMDGYEVCSILKADIKTKNIPVIFVTSLGEVKSEAHGFELGAVDYIMKPFSPDIVMARVKTHIELKRHKDFLEWMLKEKSKELELMEKEYSKLYLRK